MDTSQTTKDFQFITDAYTLFSYVIMFFSSNLSIISLLLMLIRVTVKLDC